ncbi:hypothetical protein M9H77_02236 [Catharanthus roseus]|uniref:Uncharacterized protein n=1 Tax=Catharanthus roseus TaxID=4058 RepID=A0ACC0C7Y7_CATRO|nr:hypothetical protein M9H77_02236 [Catharanthus roseus]
MDVIRTKKAIQVHYRLVISGNIKINVLTSEKKAVLINASNWPRRATLCSPAISTLIKRLKAPFEDRSLNYDEAMIKNFSVSLLAIYLYPIKVFTSMSFVRGERIIKALEVNPLLASSNQNLPHSGV